jgi:hypothetical protein
MLPNYLKQHVGDAGSQNNNTHTHTHHTHLAKNKSRDLCFSSACCFVVGVLLYAYTITQGEEGAIARSNVTPGPISMAEHTTTCWQKNIACVVNL